MNNKRKAAIAAVATAAVVAGAIVVYKLREPEIHKTYLPIALEHRKTLKSEFAKHGIFFGFAVGAGSFESPNDIPESVTQASGAAALAMELLADVRGTQIKQEEYPPEKVADITWVTKDKIIAAARMYATEKPARINGHLATDQIGRNTSYAIQAKVALRLITGNIDVEGGDLIAGGSHPEIVSACALGLNEKLNPEQRKKQLKK